MDITGRASASINLCNCPAHAKDPRQCRQGGSGRHRRSCANSVALFANMLLSDANNNSRSDRAKRNWKRTYYCCYWIGIASSSVSSRISPNMDADNNNNRRRRAALPDLVQGVNRNGQPLGPIDQPNRAYGRYLRREEEIEPAIPEDDCVRMGRQLRQIADDVEENRVRAQQLPFRDAVIHFLRVVFGVVFGINLYRLA